MHMYTHVCIYIYIYTHACYNIYIYIYIRIHVHTHAISQYTYSASNPIGVWLRCVMLGIVIVSFVQFIVFPEGIILLVRQGLEESSQTHDLPGVDKACRYVYRHETCTHVCTCVCMCASRY